VLFVTERAVFHLTADGLELTEIAPGVDLERDVLAHMAFKPIIRDLKLMDPGIFSETWGGLARASSTEAIHTNLLNRTTGLRP